MPEFYTIFARRNIFSGFFFGREGSKCPVSYVSYVSVNVSDVYNVKAQLKDALHDSDVIAVARDEAVNAAKEADRKHKTSEAELLQLQADLASSERARKAAQSERDDLLEELNSGSSARSAHVVSRLCLPFYLLLQCFYHASRFDRCYAAGSGLGPWTRAGLVCLLTDWPGKEGASQGL